MSRAGPVRARTARLGANAGALAVDRKSVV